MVSCFFCTPIPGEIQFDERIFQLGLKPPNRLYMFSALNTIYIYLAHLWEMQVKTAMQGKKAMRCIVLSDVSVFPSTAFKGLGHVRAGCVENNLGKFPQKLLVPDVSLQLAKWAS